MQALYRAPRFLLNESLSVTGYCAWALARHLAAAAAHPAGCAEASDVQVATVNAAKSRIESMPATFMFPLLWPMPRLCCEARDYPTGNATLLCISRRGPTRHWRAEETPKSRALRSSLVPSSRHHDAADMRCDPRMRLPSLAVAQELGLPGIHDAAPARVRRDGIRRAVVTLHIGGEAGYCACARSSVSWKRLNDIRCRWYAQRKWLPRLPDSPDLRAVRNSKR
jgi:hypothetical protein